MRIKWVSLKEFKKLWDNPPKAEDLQCPVCGYYCLGNGGIGCIDKPTLVKTEKDTK